MARGHVDVDPSVSLGHREDGHRMFANIFGGLIEGPFFRGKVKNGGSAWMTEDTPEFCEIQVRYIVTTVDNALIEVQSHYFRYGNTEALKEIFHKKNVSKNLYQMHAQTRLQSSHARYRWLNPRLFIGNARRDAIRVTTDFYAML